MGTLLVPHFALSWGKFYCEIAIWGVYMAIYPFLRVGNILYIFMRIENKNGRLRPQVVASDATYQKTRANIRRKIETGQHFR